MEPELLRTLDWEVLGTEVCSAVQQVLANADAQSKEGRKMAKEINQAIGRTLLCVNPYTVLS